MSKSKMSNDEWMSIMGAGGALALGWTWLRRRKASSATASGDSPKPLPEPLSPFVEGSYCTTLAGPEVVDRWLKTIVIPIAQQRIDAFDVPLDQHQEARHAVTPGSSMTSTRPVCPSARRCSRRPLASSGRRFGAMSWRSWSCSASSTRNSTT